jgi:phage shock protein PspC (stress-responsive transcriptional regulator)
VRAAKEVTMTEPSSRLRDPAEWTRDAPGRKLGGVCASVAQNLGVSVSVVRAAFLLLALWHGIGILLYAILWILMPPAPGRPSALDEVFDSVRRLLGGSGTRPERHEREELDDRP